MSLSRRPEVEPREILARLDPSLRHHELVPLGEGWDNVTWRVGADLVLRVSKYSDAAERKAVADKDIHILELVGQYCSLPTSCVVAADAADGALLLTLVRGVGAWACPPTALDRVVGQLSDLLASLREIPLADAARVVMPDRSQALWLAETAAGWERAAHLFEPADRALVEAFLAEPVPEAGGRIVFSHNDLGEEHLIVDPASGALAGVIDWSDACLGDPARDLALIVFDLDPRISSAVVARHPDSGSALAARVRWFAARAGVEGIAYRALHLPDTVARTLDILRRVI